MGIKIKYDPVGSLFLGSFQAGANQGKERRRRELMALAQRNAEMQQQSREKMLDRQFQAQRDFQNNNVNIGNIGAPVGPELKGNKTRRLALAQQQQQNQLATQTARLPAGAIMAPPGFGNQGDVYMPRDLVEQQQRQNSQQEQRQFTSGQDQLRYWRSQVHEPMPDGVKLNPPDAKRWGELDSSLAESLGGVVVDPNLPETQQKIQDIIDEKEQIRTRNPEPDPGKMLNKNIRWFGQDDTEFQADKGDPSLGRKPYLIGPDNKPQPFFDDKVEQKAAEVEQKQQQKELDRQQGLKDFVLKEQIKTINSNDDLSDEKKLEKIQELLESATPEPATAPGAPAAATPTGQPGAAAPVQAPEGTVSMVHNADEYSKVPSGTIYMDPDGKMRRKP